MKLAPRLPGTSCPGAHPLPGATPAAWQSQFRGVSPTGLAAPAARLKQNRQMNSSYETVGPSRAEVDALPGSTLVEFGTDWCGFCKAAQPLLAEALADTPSLRHLKIEDGSGRALGRSFKVKLWPTLVFMRDGQEIGRLVRPGSVASIRQELARLGSAG